MFPENMELRKVSQSRTLEALDLTPDELELVTGEQEQNVQKAEQVQEEAPVAAQGVQEQVAPQADGEEQALMSSIGDSLEQLG